MARHMGRAEEMDCIDRLEDGNDGNASQAALSDTHNDECNVPVVPTGLNDASANRDMVVLKCMRKLNPNIEQLFLGKMRFSSSKSTIQIF